MMMTLMGTYGNEFGTDDEQQKLKRYKGLMHMFWNHDIAMSCVNKIVTAHTTNFMHNLQQERFEVNEPMMTNILAKTIGDTLIIS
jgi:hypothetical protein